MTNAPRDNILSEDDHNEMDEMFGHLLDAYKLGQITRHAAVTGVGHVIAAIDKGNQDEFRHWFRQPELSYFKDLEDS